MIYSHVMAFAISPDSTRNQASGSRLMTSSALCHHRVSWPCGPMRNACLASTIRFTSRQREHLRIFTLTLPFCPAQPHRKVWLRDASCSKQFFSSGKNAGRRWWYRDPRIDCKNTQNLTESNQTQTEAVVHWRAKNISRSSFARSALGDTETQPDVTLNTNSAITWTLR